MQPVGPYATPPAKVGNAQQRRSELTNVTGADMSLNDKAMSVTNKNADKDNAPCADGWIESLMRSMVMLARQRELRTVATNEK
jgi:hypothetical protein